MTAFIDLHNHSTFSIQDGFGTPEDIAKRAVKLGWSAAAITEHGWLGSAPTFYQACKAHGIKPIIGCELYVTPDHAERTKEYSDQSFHLTTLALSREGYQNLVSWTTFAHQRENFYRKPRISISEMVEVAPWPLHHNVILSGCLGSELCRALANNSRASRGVARIYVEALKTIFPNFYIEIQNHTVPKFLGIGFEAYEAMVEQERMLRAKLIALGEHTETPIVITNDSHMQSPKQRKAHIAMKASSWRSRDDMHMGKSTEQLISTYAKDYAYYGSYMRDMEKVADGIPNQALESIAGIVEASDIRLDPLDNFSYSLPRSGYKNPLARIRSRSRKRLEAGIAKHGTAASERFEMELGAMGEFADYLLLMSDFIIAARKQGILTWTRGSAACSYLAFCLKIHDIDSIDFGLTFSRFFNPARKKLPDIDIDIDPERYDDFMRIVQEQMEPLIGEGQVIQICNLGTAANRSAFRMAASALGIPKEEQDEIAKLLPQMIDSGVVEEDAFADLKNEYPELYELTSSIFDSVKNISQHAAAWVFGTEDRPIKDWIPLSLIASSNTMVTQFDMKAIEDFGLVKGDFLRLKSLTVISNCLRAMGKSPLDFHKIPLDDKSTFEMIRAGHVEGVHTLQGKETRRGMSEMEVENIDEIIVGAALYRPANTRVGKPKIFNDRRTEREIVSYPHPIVENVVGNTFGVPVFQEQAMEIGYAVGMDDAGVDDIYQAIKKAKGVGRGAKEAFNAIFPDFRKAAKRSGFSKKEIRATWEFIKDFAGYGLNKGHATSLGIIGKRMAYLKCHHPEEYYAALLDVFDDRPTYLAAARSEGYRFVGPCVNRSAGGFSTAKDVEKAIRVGLGNVERIGPGAVKEILTHQPYNDYDDFLARTQRKFVKSNMIENLARVGALESLGVKGERSDEVEFEILGFTINRPTAFRGCKPKHVGARVSDSGWRHQGRTKGVETTDGRASVSKLFWIPSTTKLELKASPWAHVKTWLLEVLDENGIPFHLMVNEDREWEVKILKYLHRKCLGSVICVDGMIRQPFLTTGPQGFRFFGITGAGRYYHDPQMWHVTKKHKQVIDAAAEMKQRR